MTRAALRALAFVAALMAGAASAAPNPAPANAPPAAGAFQARTVLALYDSRKDEDVRRTRAQRYGAMPLHHLGLKLRFWDIAKGLPGPAEFADVRGVLAWLYDGKPTDALAYLNWANAVVDAGYRFVLMGNIAGGYSESADPATYAAAHSLLRKLGVALGDRFVARPYKATFPIYDRTVAGFEWDVEKEPAGFHESAPLPETKVYLMADAGPPSAEKGVLIAAGPRGGFVHSGYDLRLASSDRRTRWVVNPFTFFAAAFGTGDLPKPDVTTIAGRRLYYSHIDGDGWRSLSKADGYRDAPTPAADVIYHEAIQAYPDLPVTVAPIAADLDPDWLGNEPAQAAARRLFAVPQVEAAHHTYTHPFAWGFFEHYDREIEQAVSDFGSFGRRKTQERGEDDPLLGYASARAYAQQPFDLKQEIVGARDFIQRFTPAGKTAGLVQWSGNTMPFAEAVRMADANGVLNINGGDSRYDAEFPTAAAVAAIGAEFEGVRQIFASASNENTYTELWTRRFYGFRFLAETLARTESPRRLAPFNVYYHMYSGENQAALSALLAMLDLARRSELAPVEASRYVRIAHGFFDARIERLAPDVWRIHERGALETLRFPGAGAVDYGRSKGVLGHRIVNGDLYVALDGAVRTPVVAIGAAEAAAARPYLEQGRWPPSSLQMLEDGFAFRAQGYGAGAFLWRGLEEGVYQIQARAATGQTWTGEAPAGADGGLAFAIPLDAIGGVEVIVRRRSFAAMERSR